jgi:hypothetical protein
VELSLAPSYATLCVIQGLLVLAPGRPLVLARSRVLGVLILLATTGAGIGIVRGLDGGADALTAVATVATPLLFAAVGWARGWRLPWLPALATAALYAIAWRFPDTLGGDAAGLVLIGGACLTLATLIAAFVPPRVVALGLVAAVAIDVILVWGVNQTGPATEAVHAATTPAIALPGVEAQPLPHLQDGTFGSALMGWLDFLAPAVLGTLYAGRVRMRAAAATAAGALAWGLLLFVTSPIAATVPVLAGLAAGGLPSGASTASSRVAGLRPRRAAAS